MRFFLELAYKGTNYAGWQVQNNAVTVQGVLHEKLSILLNTPIEVIGCGRTDSGVHASKYYCHFDFEAEFPSNFLHRINIMLPKDIAVYNLISVHPEAHTRFDAKARSYVYNIEFGKSPFLYEINSKIMYAERLELDKLQEAASLLLNYKEFFPFCKTNADNRTMLCDLTRAEWELRSDGNGLSFHITSNRFLRGMVRLIVGMCIRVAEGKLELETVKVALDNQTRIERSWSAPPEGLFLSDILYEYIS